MNERVAKWVRCATKLELLCAVGQGDSPEADALRDEMDPYWHALSSDEKYEAVNGVDIKS